LEIRRVSTNGGAAVTLASGVVSPTYTGTFAINSTSLFYAEPNYPSTNLVKVPLAGGPATLLSVLNITPQKLVADDTHIYWIDSTGVISLPVAGGTPSTLANAVNSPVDLHLRGPDVLWSEGDWSSGYSQNGSLKRVSKTGGPVFIIVQGLDTPLRVGGDADSVYWAEGFERSSNYYGRIARIPPGGGAVESVVSGLASDSPPITVSDTHVFIADWNRIRRVSLSGGFIENVALLNNSSNYNSISNLVTDGDYVYWVEDGSDIVHKVSVDGGVVTYLPSVSDLPPPVGQGHQQIRLLDGMVYWMTDSNAILSVPVVGGTARVIASGLLPLFDFDVDGESVYFSEWSTGNIKKIPVTGGDATTLAEGLGGTFKILVLAIDEGKLYCIDNNQIVIVPTSAGLPPFIVYEGSASYSYAKKSIGFDSSNIYWTEPVTKEIKKIKK
jgi:hypothetical protein